MQEERRNATLAAEGWRSRLDEVQDEATRAKQETATLKAQLILTRQESDQLLHHEHSQVASLQVSQ